MTDNTQLFSERYRYQGPEAEITVREDAPDAVRGAVEVLSRKVGLSRTIMREVICDILLKFPNQDNWSEYPNIAQEIKELITQCPWYKVYDIAEAVHGAIILQRGDYYAEEYAHELNQVFRENGIGWELWDGLIVVRDGVLTPIYSEAVSVLENTGRPTAANELREAIRDISRRPEPDITGAIQHAIAGLEAVARDVTGKPNSTLGALIQSLKLPDKDLKEALRNLWRYSSENGRHGREGSDPGPAEAKLVVTIACAVSTFLVERHNLSQHEPPPD